SMSWFIVSRTMQAEGHWPAAALPNLAPTSPYLVGLAWGSVTLSKSNLFLTSALNHWRKPGVCTSYDRIPARWRERLACGRRPCPLHPSIGPVPWQEFHRRWGTLGQALPLTQHAGISNVQRMPSEANT